MMKLKQSLYNVLCLIVGICSLSGCVDEFEADISAVEDAITLLNNTVATSGSVLYMINQNAKDAIYEAGLEPGNYEIKEVEVNAGE